MYVRTLQQQTHRCKPYAWTPSSQTEVANSVQTACVKLFLYQSVGLCVCAHPPVKITCVTAAPNPKNTNPLPLVVSFPNGNAWSVRSDGSPVTYQYVDLWSRSTTWGGASPPGAGFIVMIPAGECLFDMPSFIVYCIHAATATKCSTDHC